MWTAGASISHQPGYDRYWQYVQEFNLTGHSPIHAAKPHNAGASREDVYSEDDLQKVRNVLKAMGFSIGKKIQFLTRHAWVGAGLPLYFPRPYLR